jgi:predicted class III extradiol MEMO1 family dioxygenase
VGIKHKEAAQLILTQLKKICIESEELLCLVNSSDLIHYIIKFGMLRQYPEFQEHFGDILNDKKGAMRKFIDEVAISRVEKANDLIEAYHRKSESKLEMITPKDEKLVEI